MNQALCYALEKENYKVSSAFSITEAKTYYTKAVPDLILLDVNLPDGEGFAFCKWAKEQNDIPVIFLTARDLEEDTLTGFDSGAEDYVTYCLFQSQNYMGVPFQIPILPLLAAIVLSFLICVSVPVITCRQTEKGQPVVERIKGIE